MALTESPRTPMGSPCPDFALPSVDGRIWRRDEISTPLLLLVFMCNHCPYVQAVDDRINELAKRYKGRCTVLGINANDASAYPEDGFEAMQLRAQQKGYAFPYLHDENQTVAKAFGAVCTPDFFLYDANRLLAYRGRLDDHWQDARAVNRQDLLLAIEALLTGQLPDADQRPSMGCSIKWKF